jgi:YD repeat-containing protein
VSYTLDDVGNRTQRVDRAGTHTYEYDDLYRLTEVTYPLPAMGLMLTPRLCVRSEPCRW